MQRRHTSEAARSRGRGRYERRAELVLDGGALDIEWLANGHVEMTGPVATSFRGTIDPSLLSAGMVFGADLIAGFPTETEAMFENSLRLIEECGLTFLHVFPYSARRGTPAARMPQLSGQLRKERAARLRAAGEAARRRFFAGRIGAGARVLVEKSSDGAASGHCEQFSPVRIAAAVEPGRIVAARITGATAEALVARLAD